MPDQGSYNIDDIYNTDNDYGFLSNYITSLTKPISTNADVVEPDDFYPAEDNDTDDQQQIEDTYTEPEEQPQTPEYDYMKAYIMGADGSDEYSAGYDPTDISSGYPTEQADTHPNSSAYSVVPGVDMQDLQPETSGLAQDLSSYIPGMTITSGYRSVQHNKDVGGVNNSYHTKGQALDIRPSKDSDKFFTSSAGKAYIAKKGYKIIDERSKPGGSHWHLQPKQAGGNNHFVIPQSSENISNSSDYGTTLSPEENIKYEAWRSKLPKNLQYEGDYDLKGLWKSNPLVKPSANLHFPDTYKLPNHPTFSNESIYFNDQTRNNAGHWQESDSDWMYIPYNPNVKDTVVERKMQIGGQTSVAYTPEQQYTGLNDESLNDLQMPLEGTNTIRGLDSGDPVYVRDSEGKSAVLRGPKDKVKMKGKIIEKRLKSNK